MAEQMSDPLSPDQVAGNWSAIAADYERAFEELRAQSPDGVPTLTVEACLGLGRA